MAQAGESSDKVRGWEGVVRGLWTRLTPPDLAGVGLPRPWLVSGDGVEESGGRVGSGQVR